MIEALLLSLSVLYQPAISHYSFYQGQPVYERLAGQLFQPYQHHGPTTNSEGWGGDRYLTHHDELARPYQGPTYSHGGLRGQGFEDRYFQGSSHGPLGYDVYRSAPPPHGHYNNHGPLPYNHHAGSFHHRNGQADGPWGYGSHDRKPASGDSLGSPDRDRFNDRTQPPRRPVSGGSRTTSPMEVIYSWKQVDFEFPNKNVREEMIRNQLFIPRNNLILDLDIYGEGVNRRVFVTLPRVRRGVPVSLATVTDRRRGDTTLLRPFPNWNAHNPGDCQNSITSVLRTHVDQCGRLWVLDSGNNNAFTRGESRIVCPPQILIYNLEDNDRLIGKYRFPASMIANTSLLVTINVDTRARDCSDSVAYVADSLNFKIIAFRLQTNQFWSMNSALFRPDPDLTRFSVNGVDFQLSGGIFGLALGPVVRGRRPLFFHSIGSVKQSVVDTTDIEDPRPWLASVDAKPEVFRELNGSRSSQSAAAAMTDRGVMFFGLIGSNEIACWNSNMDFGEQNIVVLGKDNTNLQFVSGIKVYGGKLYVVTNRLQNYLTNQIPEEEVNYRILAADLRTLTRGTPCDLPDYHRPNNYY